MDTTEWEWPDEAATRVFAARLAGLPELADCVIALHGDLGAGKTTFVRHLLQALGVQGRIKSPTYAVVEPYEVAHRAIWHFDFYRFGDPREWEDAGFRDIFASAGLKLVEWPDRASSRLPACDLTLSIALGDHDLRRVTGNAGTARGVRLIKAMR